MVIFEFFGVTLTLGSIVAGIQQFMSTISQVIGEFVSFFLQHKVFATMFLFVMVAALSASPSLNLCFYQGRFGCVFSLNVILVCMLLWNIVTLLP